MKNQAGLLSDVDNWEYSVVCFPDEQLIEEISRSRIECGLEQNISAANFSSFITFVEFTARERMEETLARWIRNICKLHSRFTLTVNNYSGKPPHTIYIRVQNNTSLQKLSNGFKILDSFLASNNCPHVSVAQPRLVIGDRLPEFVYEESLKNFAQKSFYHSFQCEKVFLIRHEPDGNFFVVDSFVLSEP